jgi:hypothetical protein
MRNQNSNSRRSNCMPSPTRWISRCFTPTTVLVPPTKSARRISTNAINRRRRILQHHCETTKRLQRMGPGHHCEEVRSRKPVRPWCHDSNRHCAKLTTSNGIASPEGVDESKNFFTRDAVDGPAFPRKRHYGKHRRYERVRQFVGIWGALTKRVYHLRLPAVQRMNKTNIHHS